MIVFTNLAVYTGFVKLENDKNMYKEGPSHESDGQHADHENKRYYDGCDYEPTGPRRRAF